ncbi:Fe-S protein [Paenibacillus sp. MSJ-34]|uniref:Fe-S protein n=1 Tax=Paenibacillus sp. MSJ-34 TaxID=2841529 RepID=UPI001C0F4719|nr:Fe-S protein [Paenibacillus sp. MSJ-34]MBU5441213.1 Fe-S protein [Paenibacillus sp. MSJ-34]
MIDASVRKANLRWNILQNPTVITIRIAEKVRKGGGFTEVKSEIGPMTVRIFADSRQAQGTIVSDTPGRKETSSVYSLLADDTAGLTSGPNIEQEFDADPYGSFRIGAVHPQIVNGEICGYYADIERVK